MVQSHRDLVVWQKAMDMTVQVYELTKSFPSTEMYRLTAQVTRAAASVPANIAEGHGRGYVFDTAALVDEAFAIFNDGFESGNTSAWQ